ncbi:chemotaxis protein CheW [Hyphomicrobium sp.]|jgi:purine-binding chemotaxis protein CheW|uniref:chemotaxis protein CheW n=1 Tax=Hyphomicrobium sp. TaxID=82 RepID=UPI00356642EB
MNEMKSESSQVHELIAFRMGQQEYCVDVMALREIRGWTPATPLPHAPSHVLGVINLRGTVLPIIDLSARMGFAPAEPTTRHAIMVTEIGEQVVGLLVDAVSEIFSATADQIQPTPDVATEMAKAVVRGVIPAEGRMISFLSLDTIPSSHAQIT